MQYVNYAWIKNVILSPKVSMKSDLLQTIRSLTQNKIRMTTVRFAPMMILNDTTGLGKKKNMYCTGHIFSSLPCHTQG